MFKQKSKKSTTIKRVSSVAAIVLILMASFVASVWPAPTVTAATSNTINFQARLLTAAGSVVPDGYYNVEFKIFKTDARDGGETGIQGACTTNPGAVSDEDCVWTETRIDANKVRVANGYLTVNLGSVTAFGGSIPWDQQLWLTMNIGGTGSPSWDGEMNPRLKLTAVPYAFSSGKVVSSDGTGSATVGDGETGTICLQNATNCGFATTSGSGSYIQNQNASAQSTSNFWISGIGRAATSLQAPLIDAATNATALDIGTTNANAINLKKATTITGNLTQGTGVFGLSGNSTSSISVTNGDLTISSNTSNKIVMSTTSITLETVGSGTVNVGNSNTATVNVGGQTNNARTINIGYATASSQSQTVNIGATVSTGAVTIQSGSSGTTVRTNGGFRVLDATSNELFTVNGTATATFGKASTLSGKLVFYNGTNANTITIQTPNANGVRTITLADETGTLCLQSSTSCGFATATGATGYIQNQTSGAQSTSGFWISGTGRSNSGFTATSFDTTTNAALNIGTTAANALTFGNTTYNTAITLNSGTGAINVGTGAQDRSISIGTGAAAQTLVLGSSTSTSTTTIQGGSGGINLTADTSSGGVSVKSATNSTSAFKVINASDNEILTVDTSGSQTAFGKASSLNAKLLLYNSSNGNTISIQSGATLVSYTLTLPTSLGAAGNCLKDSDGNGLLVFGSCGSGGGGGGNLQDTYTASTSFGEATPEIRLSTGASGPGSFDIQDANTTLGASATLFAVRASNGSGLGDALFSVQGDGTTTIQSKSGADNTDAFSVKNGAGATVLDVDTANKRVGINVAAPARTLDIAVNDNAVNTPALRLAQAGGGDTSIELSNAASGKHFYLGQDASNGGAFTIGSSTAAGADAANDTPTFVQASTGASDDTVGASIATSFLSPVGANNTIVTAIAWDDSSGAKDVQCTDNHGNTYAKTTALESNVSQWLTICYSIGVAAGSTTVTATFVDATNAPANGRYRRISASEYANIAAIDTVQSGLGDSTSPITASDTPSAANSLVYGAVINAEATGDIAAGASFTERAHVIEELMTEDRVLTTPATVAATATFNAASAYVIYMLIFEPTTGEAGTLTDAFSGALMSMTSTGDTTFRNSSNSSTAFRILNAANVPLFSTDTSNNRVYIGNPSSDTTGSLLVLDTKSDATDPSGVNGGMYYNSNLGRFRCYEADVWKDCSHRSIVRLSADVQDVTGNDSLTNVTGLSFPVISGVNYAFECRVRFTSAATTTGSRWTINGPTTSALAYESEYTLGSTTTTRNPLLTTYQAPGASNATSGNTAANLATVKGFIVPSASGTVNLQFATEISASAITAKAGSSCEWW